MKLKIDENSDNYFGTVIRIEEIYPIENADNLNRAVLFGNNLIISKDIKVGDIMIYFVAGTQLSEDYCFHNNLYDSAELNKDTEQKGYISAKRRLIKALKLRGTISDGMLLPLSSLAYLENQTLDPKFMKIGDEFTHISDVEICRKYQVPVKEGKAQQAKQEKVDKLKDLILPNQFKLHTSTAHFARNLENIKPETEIIVTRKMHGSSLILSHVLLKKKLKWFEKLLDHVIPQIKSEYGYVYSSGKPKSKLPKGVVFEKFDWNSPTKSFYSTDYWLKAYQLHRSKLEKGISIYAEIVGQGIQKGDYTYGYDYEIFVYRITQTNSDGQSYEFSWDAVIEYCKKYELRYVEEYFRGKVSEIVGKQGTPEQLLQKMQEAYLDKSYNDCKVDEGVCIRIRETNEILKLKSPLFILGESKNLEAGVGENES